MIRDRERFYWVTLPAATAVLGVLLTSSSLGYLCSRVEIRQHRVVRQQAEAARADLEEHLEALRAGPPAPAAPAPQPVIESDPADARRIAELEKKLSALRRDKKSLESKLDRAGREVTRLEAAKQRLELANAKRREPAPVPAAAAAPEPEPAPAAAAPDRVAERPAITPAVSAEAPNESAPARCGGVEHAPYAIKVADVAHSLLDRQLTLRADATQTGLTLEIDDAGSNELDGTPQHFSWSCDGEPYIVSVCRAEAEPFRVSGVVWRAGDRWRDPCKGAVR